MTGTNPILRCDFPDPDVIRVGDTYYMVSTTMHFMPGGVILRSFDLIHWEIASYLYDELESTPEERLEGEKCAYGQGMWAGSLRYHDGTFYVSFIANDTHRTYLFRSKSIEGPWQRQNIEGFYYDSSLYFEDDRVFIVHGNTEIYLTELNSDLTGPKPGGLNRLLVRDRKNAGLGYEGSHFYKINGKYYLFLIHWPNDGTKRRVETCFVSDSLEGGFRGKDIMDDDMGFFNQGVAQGGIVDTPDGKWYAMLFQDHGAVGRVPVLVPMHWENDFPVLGIDGKAPKLVETTSTRPEHRYAPLYGSDDFRGETLKSFWQWNHIPNHALWSLTERPGHLRIRSGKLCTNVCQAVNTLTQRTVFPECEASVTVDGSGLHDGDYAGLCTLQGCYAFLALTKENGKYYIAMVARELEDCGPTPNRVITEPGREFARIPVDGPVVALKAKCTLPGKDDEAEFFYLDSGEWKKVGITHKLFFRLDQFVGCRFALFLFSTKTTGGVADFSDFRYACSPAQ
jgi:beta-xylosidase